MAAHPVTVQAQVRALAKAVSAAFAASNLTEAEKSPGKIEITDLPWQAPPLITPHLLSGAKLQDYFDAPLSLDQHRLYRFWVRTLEDMWHRPSMLYLKSRGALANCSPAMASTKVGQRVFRFSRPAGWPSLDEQAGAMFSLEVAHAAAISLPIRDLVSDDDNYYVEFDDAMRIGVIDGRPACASLWQASVAGMVQDLLTMPRGEADYTCHHDQLASLRSVLHLHPANFPHNFDALDQALQALRLLSLGSYCPELLQEMRLSPLALAEAREKERALASAIDVVGSSISDRNKLLSLQGLLVPVVLSASGFRRYVCRADVFPFTLARGKLEAIRQFLVEQYGRLPDSVRREGVCNP